MKISFDLVPHRPSSLGSRSLVLVRQADIPLAVYDFYTFSYGTCFRLFEYIHTISVNNFIPVDLRLVFEANAATIVCRQNFEAMIILVDHYY